MLCKESPQVLSPVSLAFLCFYAYKFGRFINHKVFGLLYKLPEYVSDKFLEFGDSVMDIAVQCGVAYVDALSCKQPYLSVLLHAEVVFQTEQTGKQFRREYASKVFQRMSHRAREGTVCKLYPCRLVHMLHVMDPHMFYDPVFPHIRHTVALHEPSPFGKRVILVHFMYHNLVNFQFGLRGTRCGFLSP